MKLSMKIQVLHIFVADQNEKRHWMYLETLIIQLVSEMRMENSRTHLSYSAFLNTCTYLDQRGKLSWKKIVLYMRKYSKNCVLNYSENFAKYSRYSSDNHEELMFDLWYFVS